jgi:hypothetical protein
MQYKTFRTETIIDPNTGEYKTLRWRWESGGFNLIDERTSRDKALDEINQLARSIERAYTGAARHDERATDADRDRRAELAANARAKAARYMKERDALIAKLGDPNA